MNVGGVLLAAGGSTRLGTPKQLLTYRGRTLLRRAAETALAAGCRPVAAVLGSGAERLRAELAGLDVRIVDNPDWTRGMGTSVRLGLAALEGPADAEALDGVLLTLCDQPLVTAEKLAGMLERFRRLDSPGGSIVAAAYNGTVGVPVLFGRTHFEELRVLPADAGAKPILRRHRDRAVPFPLPEAATDIDTPEQYGRLAGG